MKKKTESTAFNSGCLVCISVWWKYSSISSIFVSTAAGGLVWRDCQQE